jgi:hypothetical protein
VGDGARRWSGQPDRSDEKAAEKERGIFTDLPFRKILGPTF